MILTIRIADATEAELIDDLSRQTFYETFASQNTKKNMDKFMNGTFRKEELIREVDTPGNTFFLAYDENEPVGYVRMIESNNPSDLGN